MKKNHYFLIAVFILFLFTLSIWAENYLKMIGDDWHPQVVKNDEVTLLKNKNYPCQVKAYGWKILDKYRDKLGIFGDLYIKWGWKIVVHNPQEIPIMIAARIMLKSNEEFVLNYSDIGNYEYDPLESILHTRSQRWIQPGETEIFQGVSTYNHSKHKGEGSPGYLSFRIRCK